MLDGPVLGLIFMALGAGIGCADFFRKVGTRNADAVIAPVIDTHVGSLRHVAFYATCARAPHRMEVVGWRVEVALVTLEAKRIPRELELHRMRIVAVGASHVGMKHFALNVGAVDINLLVDLAVVVIEAIGNDGRQMGVVKALPCRVDRFAELAMGVASGTGLDLDVGLDRGCPLREIGFRVNRPTAFLGFLQGHDKSLRTHIVFQFGKIGGRGFSRFDLESRLGPLDVLGSWSVTGLAGHIHIRPGRVVAESLRIESLVEIGGVTIGAHVVPVEVLSRPVEKVVGGDFLVGVEVIPALSAFFGRPRIPADLERLVASAFEGDQILLQGIVTEGVVHLHVAILAILVLSVDPVFLSLAEEAEFLPEVIELRVIEITEDELLRRRIHRLVVIAQEPFVILLLVTFGAVFQTDMGGFRNVVVGRVGRFPDCFLLLLRAAGDKKESDSIEEEGEERATHGRKISGEIRPEN